MDACAVGLDLGGTFIKGAMVNPEGKILAWKRVPTGGETGFREVIRRMETLVRTLAGERTNLTAVGVGVPGMLDPERKQVILAPNLGWKNLDLKEVLEHNLRIPVYLDNDANLAALGEWWLGGARNFDCFLLVTIGTGIGSGMVLGGKLYRGINGLAPELGHMTVDREGPLCGCGRKGCLETLVSATAILREARESGLELPGNSGAKEVFQLAGKGDPIAAGVVDRAMEYLATGLKNTIVLLDPQLILIGGGIGEMSEMFIQVLRDRVMKMLPVKRRIQISPAALGNRAGALGAAGLGFLEMKGRGH